MPMSRSLGRPRHIVFYSVESNSILVVLIPTRTYKMDSQRRQSNVQRAKHPTFIYIVLIGVVSETIFLHFRATAQSDQLRLRIHELEKQQGLNIQELAELRSLGSHKQHFYMKHVKDFHKVIQLRVRRGIQKKNQPILRTLNTLKSQIFRLMRSESTDKGVCNNVTLVCRKGERGPRGKSGPRGYKGDIGVKGERGKRHSWLTGANWSNRSNWAKGTKG